MGSRSSLTTTPSMSTSNDISDNVCADETPVGYGARGWETRSGVVGATVRGGGRRGVGWWGLFYWPGTSSILTKPQI